MNHCPHSERSTKATAGAYDQQVLRASFDQQCRRLRSVDLADAGGGTDRRMATDGELLQIQSLHPTRGC
ncbi:MAG: hypothetical protein ACI841_002926 [Planctomycetota bacterium]|jgi:hypothetical protein